MPKHIRHNNIINRKYISVYIKESIFMFNNIPDVKLGIIAVSRDCFIVSLSEIVESNRRSLY